VNLSTAIIIPMAIIAMVAVAVHGIIDDAIVKTTELVMTTTITITTGRVKIKEEAEDHRHHPNEE